MIVNNPFGGNYPFIEPSDDIKGLVYDAYVSYYDPTLNYKLPLRITSIGPRYVAVKDADDTVLFDGILTRTPWSNEYSILKGSNGVVVVSFIISNAVDSVIEPEHGEICLRCVYTMPKHVTSISVVSPNEDGVMVRSPQLTGKLDLEYGYNMDLNVSVDRSEEIRHNSIIRVDAGPGLGLGKIKRECDTDYLPVASSINGLEPDDNGDLSLVGDDCIAIQHLAANQFLVIDGCLPCCKCEEFSTAGNVLDLTINEYYKQGATVEAARDALAELIEMLACGNILVGMQDVYHPLRCYIDTTWPRKPAITVEFRNVLPAVVYDLKVKVNVECGQLCRHKALRTMYMDDVTQSGILNDTQDYDNFKRIDGIKEDSFTPSNKWTVDWTDKELSPGATIWSTVAARNHLTPKYMPAENISAIATASYKLKPLSCAQDSSDCLNKLKIMNTATAFGTIKGGTAYSDPTGEVTPGSVKRKNDSEITEDIREAAKEIHKQDKCSEGVE